MTKVAQAEMLIHQLRVTTGRFSCPHISDLLAQQRGKEFMQIQFAFLAVLYFFFVFLWAGTIKINEVSFAFMFSVLNWLR